MGDPEPETQPKMCKFWYQTTEIQITTYVDTFVNEIVSYVFYDPLRLLCDCRVSSRSESSTPTQTIPSYLSSGVPSISPLLIKFGPYLTEKNFGVKKSTPDKRVYRTRNTMMTGRKVISRIHLYTELLRPPEGFGDSYSVQTNL